MVHDPDILDRLQRLEAITWDGVVYRHMVNDYAGDRENRMGARWNPPDVAAIYTALSRGGAIAEYEHRRALESLATKFRVTRRTIFTAHVELESVLEVSSRDLLEELGIAVPIGMGSFEACQKVGGAASWLDHDGLLVPSARLDGLNLVIFPDVRPGRGAFDIVDREDIPV